MEMEKQATWNYSFFYKSHLWQSLSEKQMQNISSLYFFFQSAQWYSFKAQKLVLV